MASPLNSLVSAVTTLQRYSLGLSRRVQHIYKQLIFPEDKIRSGRENKLCMASSCSYLSLVICEGYRSKRQCFSKLIACHNCLENIPDLSSRAEVSYCWSCKLVISSSSYFETYRWDLLTLLWRTSCLILATEICRGRDSYPLDATASEPPKSTNMISATSFCKVLGPVLTHAGNGTTMHDVQTVCVFFLDIQLEFHTPGLSSCDSELVWTLEILVNCQVGIHRRLSSHIIAKQSKNKRNQRKVWRYERNWMERRWGKNSDWYDFHDWWGSLIQ